MKIKNKLIIWPICGLLLVLNGCASIVSGMDQNVSIRSDPPAANVWVDGEAAGETPLDIELARRKRHRITVRKDGFGEEEKYTGKSFNWWTAGNIFPAGVIGVVLDIVSGAAYDIQPDPINVILFKSEPGEINEVINSKIMVHPVGR